MGYTDPVVGEYIRMRRERHQLSLRQLAAQIGISPAHLSDVERGNRMMSVSLAFRLCKSLKSYQAEWMLREQLKSRISAMKKSLEIEIAAHHESEKNQ